MTLPAVWLKWFAALLCAVWVAWLAVLWQPLRQIELHTTNLLARLSARDHVAVAGMICPEFRNAWGHGREESLRKADELFNHFFTLKILPSGPMDIRLSDGQAVNRVPLGIFGSGTPVAQAVMGEVREVGGSFVFRWRKAGSWPWQWLLVEAGHAELAARFPE